MSPITNGAIVAFQNVGSGTCIDLTGSNPANGTPLIGYHCSGSDNQHWKLKEVGKTSIWPVYIICSVSTGTCIDLLYGGQADGTQIEGWAETKPPNNDHQRWRFVTADPEFGNLVMIQNVGTGTYIDLFNGSGDNGANITGWAGQISDNPHQQWKVVNV